MLRYGKQKNAKNAKEKPSKNAKKSKLEGGTGG